MKQACKYCAHSMAAAIVRNRLLCTNPLGQGHSELSEIAPGIKSNSDGSGHPLIKPTFTPKDGADSCFTREPGSDDCLGE